MTRELGVDRAEGPLAVLAGTALSWPLAGALRRLAPTGPTPSVAELDRALGERAGVRFVPARPRGRRARGARRLPYDAAIVVAREVPTRPGNLHDLMNALVWATFPRAKRALHARQHALAETRGPTRPGEVRHRCAEGDVLAMLDEGGVVILARGAAEEEATRAARARDARALAALTASGRALGVAFGHALYEHLACSAPVLPLTLAVVLRDPEVAGEAPCEAADRLLAERVSDPAHFRDKQALGSVPLSPSVLGVGR